MTQKLSNTDRYAATPDQMIEMLSDPDYIAAKYSALGDLKFSVEEQTNDGSSLTTKVSRTVASNMPDAAQKVLGKENDMVQTENWDISGPTKTGAIVIESPPAKIKTATKIVPVGDSECDYTAEFEIKVSVPLIGGRIEKMVKSETADSLVKEKTFNEKWLDEH